MNNISTLLVLVIFIFCCGNNDSKKNKPLPKLKAKLYSISIAPSHLVDNPNLLLESDLNWIQLAHSINHYKY